MRSPSNKGFTLVEMVVVTGIFALIATIVIAGFRSGNRTQRLVGAADQLAGNVKKAQGLAYSNTKQKICSTDNLVCLSGSACDGTYPANCVDQYVSHYGMAIDIDSSHNKYMLGADYGNMGNYVTGEAIPNGIVTLPSGIVIDSVTPAPAAGAYALEYIYDAANSSPFVTCSINCTTTIVLKDTETLVTKSVVVQKQTGAVYVQ
jgi:prepilin-type N-terminal cleavage/methylation domain-containing protein